MNARDSPAASHCSYPGWDGTVDCRFVEIEAHRKLSYTWSVPFLDTVVTFTLTPTASGTRPSLVQSGFKSDQKQEFGGALAEETVRPAVVVGDGDGEHWVFRGQ